MDWIGCSVDLYVLFLLICVAIPIEWHLDVFSYSSV
jgi:hypothetical protein